MVPNVALCRLRVTERAAYGAESGPKSDEFEEMAALSSRPNFGCIASTAGKRISPAQGKEENVPEGGTHEN